MNNILYKVPGILPGQEPLASDLYKFVYQPLTKVGCKTFKSWMVMLEMLQGYDFNPSNEDHQDEIKNLWDQYTTNHFDKTVDFNIHAFCNQKYGVLTNNKNIEGYHKLIIVRNPWDRIASCFTDKVTQNTQYYKIELMQDWFKQHSGNNLDYFDKMGRFTFLGFLEALDKIFSEKIVELYDPHWLPQKSIIDLYLKDFDTIIKLENIDKEFNDFKQLLKIPIVPNSFSVVDKQITNGKQIKNKKTKVTYNSMYNSKISDKVFKIYREDIELLNYNNNHLDI